MNLSELALRTSDLEVISFTAFDGLRVMERDLTGKGPCLFLAAVRVDARIEPSVLAFVPSEGAGKAIIDAVVTAYNSGARTVDVRACVRPPTFEEMLALEELSGETAGDPGPPGAAAEAPGGGTAGAARPSPDPDTIPSDDAG